MSYEKRVIGSNEANAASAWTLTDALVGVLKATLWGMGVIVRAVAVLVATVLGAVASIFE